ncbi:MAG: PLP-dependent transferase [Thermomicrobia bacterium]|nr:PLP-dependent transferase [Thermomicrobia bacterium]
MTTQDERPERNERDGWDLDTLLIHANQGPDPQTGAIVPPIHPSSTFVRQRIDDDARFRYARGANPTRETLEAILADLEHGAGASAFGSGMAAVTAALQLLSADDHAIVGYDCYLSTYHLFANDLPRYGVAADFVDLGDPAAVRAALRPNTRMIWIETPTNPLLDIVDLREMATIAVEAGALTVVDNTFASPYCQNPLDWGIDLVVHSTTKYLGGHSDLVGGAVIARTKELAARITDRQYYLGAVPSPFDCWLLIRGMRTLGVRMRQHMENAQAIAEWLCGHPKVTRVLYPGLPDHPGHALARRQMPGGFSGMVSFAVEGGSAAARRVSEGTRIFQLATSLGGVESLIFPPTAWLETDKELLAQIPGSPWAQHPGLLRLSVGIEAAHDLIADLDAALTCLADRDQAS